MDLLSHGSHRDGFVEIDGDNVTLYPMLFQPDDERTSWFLAIASTLAACRDLKVDVWKGSERKAVDEAKKAYHKLAPHGRIQMSAIGVCFLALKQHQDMLGLARVFSYAPLEISQTIRDFKLGGFLGTETTRYLVQCLLNEVHQAIKNDLDPDPELVSAAVNLMTAYIRRDEQGWIAHRPNATQFDKIRRAFDIIEDTLPGRANLQLLAIKNSIVFSSVINAALDMALENATHAALLEASVMGVGGVISAGVGAAPVGGSALSKVTDSLTALSVAFTHEKLKSHDKSQLLVHQAVNAFNSKVLNNAKRGIILCDRWNRFTASSAEAAEYAATAKEWLKMTTMGLTLND